MRTAIRAVLAFVFGLVATYIVVVTVAFTYVHINNVFDRDGGLSMGILFIMGPFAGMVGGILAAISFPIWQSRREAAKASGAVTAQPAKPRLPANVRAIVAAAAWFIGAFIVSGFLIRLTFGNLFDTYAAARIAGLAPYGFGLAAAALAVFVVMRNARRRATPPV